MGLISRRQLLRASAGAAVVAAAGGVGVAVGASGHRRTVHRSPPPLLVDAVAREQSLLAELDAELAAPGSSSAALSAIRADHEAHRFALQALVDQATVPRPTASATTSTPVATPVTGKLLAAEQAAQTAAATASNNSSGALAALFASISACEAGHVALLS